MGSGVADNHGIAAHHRKEHRTLAACYENISPDRFDGSPYVIPAGTCREQGLQTFGFWTFPVLMQAGGRGSKAVTWRPVSQTLHDRHVSINLCAFLPNL